MLKTSMKNIVLTCLAMLASHALLAQGSSIKGQLQASDGTAVPYANVALYASDSSLVKVETTDEAGIFQLKEVAAATYRLVATYLGMPDLQIESLVVKENMLVDVGVLAFQPAGVELATATVSTTRALVEVKPDRTVFNVQGTINAVGDNGLDLLRKAPGVTVDNNDNINVLSRSGVLVYVDGKRLPLGGEDLSNYLRNLTAEQIDRIDIITNPGAKYEAEGNAGIIDIRLKKNEGEGTNGTFSTTYSQGRYHRASANLGGNYRNSSMNIFGTLAHSINNNWNDMAFESFQNGLYLDETNRSTNQQTNPSFRLGADFFLSEKHTLGFLINGQATSGTSTSVNNIGIYTIPNAGIRADSLLRAANLSDFNREQQTYNINYRYDIGKGKSLNIDFDYGHFYNQQTRDQPNRYFSPDGSTLVSEVINYFDTPIGIDIFTAKTDYESPLGKGVLSSGLKFSKVQTDNTFQFFDVIGSERQINEQRSNQFNYDENVYAAYLGYAGQLNTLWSYSLGLRSEITDATGLLTTLRADLGQDPVLLNYISFFPSAGLTYQLNATKGNSLAVNYGRRINRPDYNILNPFRNQMSELSYERGNPFLNPEIVDNIELGYTLAYRYNFKLAFSRTSNQITRLIGPDDLDPRAGFISWDNLATQTNYSFNASLPFSISKKWNAFFNISAGYIDNQADYGDGAVIDLQAFTYTLFSQQTFNLPWALTGELSGYFSGPGIWGGVFKYETSGAFNVGLQKRFFKEQLNVKISGNDLFFTSGWRGNSVFNGLESRGRGNWDSRRATISLSYNFGNQNVKSRNRKTGLEGEANRVGGN